MEKTYFYIFAYSALLVTFQMPSLVETSMSLATDQSALLALKANIESDPHRILTKNWTNSSFVCSWIGVTCSFRHHRVTALNISSMDLSGAISPQLGNLSFLVSVDLTYNYFAGTLPQELSLLHRLKFMNLSFNNFSGGIPLFLNLLPKLEHLSLKNNSLSGFIPTSLSNLSNLLVLNFAFNSLQGKIPEELGSLCNLQYLNVESNRLSGPMPATIFNISTLETLAFSYNELNGNLPIDMCRKLPFLKKVHLSNNQLSGQIPPNLSQCSELQIMTLSYNSFGGQIPAEIGKLKSLQILYLGGNNLNGVLPQEIGNLQNVVEFGIEKNQITGALPLNIFNMSSLRKSLLWRNKLTGNLPRDIGNLTKLNELRLSDNKLTGVLPREIGQLYQLKTLSLSLNSFTGSISPGLFNISTLRSLSLAANGLSGTLPTNLCYALPVLEKLLLGLNYLSGAIPDSVSNCSNLRTFDLYSNKFTGFLPHFLGNARLLERVNLGVNNLRIESSSSELSFISSLTNCRSLKRLGINDNPLDGIIPASIGNLSSSLQYFYAYNCKIKGSIPPDIGNLSNLVALSLYDNELSGNIPLTVKRLHKLQALDIDSNNLGGPIPEGMCDLRNLFLISLDWNQFSDSIPECLGNLTSLRHLYLDSNLLTSSIPSSLWNLKDLLTLNVSSNLLSGILPPEMGNLVAAISIDLSMNRLSESIPSTIGNLQNLVILHLEHNRLEGSIPVSVGRMISLVNLDFSYNNLSGSIPKSLETLHHLEYFNVSFNSLSGEIPTGGPFRNFSVESFKANEAQFGIPRFHVPLCHAVSNHMSKRKKVEFALFVLAGVAALITVVSLTSIFIRYRSWKDKAARRMDEVVSIIPERISYYEILQATEQFSESNLIGTGSFGSVYRGIHGEGNAIAVKVFNVQREAAFKSFDIECEVLRNIRHRNLIKVIGNCSNEDFKALILEYMPKGNLEKCLYSHNYCLDVLQRLNIMIDVASALEYLHHGYSTPIVHCDLKPSNVLLDEEMVAHVSDFGIAKLLGNKDSTVLTNTLATLGYIAPEYGLEGIVSTRCDVYSFGVMLMETFTRKRPSDDMFAGDLSLKSWVESSLTNSPNQVIDANLLNFDDKHFDKVRQCVSSVLKLAMKCSVESPRDRINMKDALAELQKIKSHFFQ